MIQLGNNENFKSVTQARFLKQQQKKSHYPIISFLRRFFDNVNISLLFFVLNIESHGTIMLDCTSNNYYIDKDKDFTSITL